MKCNICGTEFVPKKRKHYISRNKTNVRTGLISLCGSNEKEPDTFDTFDCPECGCQCIAQERKRVYYDSPEVAFGEVDGSENYETIQQKCDKLDKDNVSSEYESESEGESEC